MPLSDADRKAKIKSRRGLQKRIADKLGVSQGHLSLVISGKRPPTDREKKEIARRLRLPVDEVFPPKGEPAEPQQPQLATAS